MRRYFEVKIKTVDGEEYYYHIYIRGSEPAVKEAKKQLNDRYGYTDMDIENVVVHQLAS